MPANVIRYPSSQVQPMHGWGGGWQSQCGCGCGGGWSPGCDCGCHQNWTCNYPPPPPCPITGPIIGVVNGVDAKPGEVGEYIGALKTIPIPVGAQNIPVSVMVIPAGDWNAWAWCQTEGSLTHLAFYLDPTPAGFSNQMSGSSWGSVPTDTGGIIIGSLCRVLISQPTLLAFAFISDSTGAQNGVLHTEARRMR